jgi:hypothetical protein
MESLLELSLESYGMAIRAKIVAVSVGDSRAGCTDLADRLLRPSIGKLRTHADRQHFREIMG